MYEWFISIHIIIRFIIVFLIAQCALSGAIKNIFVRGKFGSAAFELIIFIIMMNMILNFFSNNNFNLL